MCLFTTLMAAIGPGIVVMLFVFVSAVLPLSLEYWLRWGDKIPLATCCLLAPATWIGLAACVWYYGPQWMALIVGLVLCGLFLLAIGAYLEWI